MLRTFQNTDHERRVWPSIQTPDGSTLELGPGAYADLDVADDFDVPHLVESERPVSKVTRNSRRVKKTDDPDATDATDTDNETTEPETDITAETETPNITEEH